MEQNWAVKEAGKVKSKDVVILEKPNVKRYLDRLLLKRFWPDILDILTGCDYSFYPNEKPKTEFELSNVLTKSLMFMLLDDNKAFFRGVLTRLSLFALHSGNILHIGVHNYLKLQGRIL